MNKKKVVKLVIIFIVITCINAFVFSNFSTCIHTGPEKELDLSTVTGEGVTYTGNGNISIVAAGGTLLFEGVGIASESITLVFRTEDNKIVEGTIACTYG